MKKLLPFPMCFTSARGIRVSLLLPLAFTIACSALLPPSGGARARPETVGRGHMQIAPLTFTGQHTTAASAGCQPPPTSLKPRDIAELYGFTRLWSQGVQGSGKTIYLVEIDAFQAGDIQNYFACVGVPTTQLQVTTVGAAPQQVLGESTLDIEMVAGLSRQANIVDVQTDGNAPGDLWQHINACLQSVLAKATATGPGNSVVSISLGQPESLVSAADRQALDASFASLYNVGVPVFVASGDSGAALAQGGSPPSTSFPSSDPWVTSVGGTVFVPTAQGGRADSQGRLFTEVGWSGSGGGASGFYTRQPFQQATGIPPTAAMRMVPDVSAVASDLALYLNGQWITAGGTSAAAPIWASGATLVEQANASAGAGRPLLTPALYSTGAWAPGAFFDITQGKNPLPASPGWDAVTGLGTPNLPELVQVMRQQPAG